MIWNTAGCCWLQPEMIKIMMKKLTLVTPVLWKNLLLTFKAVHDTILLRFDSLTRAKILRHHQLLYCRSTVPPTSTIKAPTLNKPPHQILATTNILLQRQVSFLATSEQWQSLRLSPRCLLPSQHHMLNHKLLTTQTQYLSWFHRPTRHKPNSFVSHCSSPL